MSEGEETFIRKQFKLGARAVHVGKLVQGDGSFFFLLQTFSNL